MDLNREIRQAITSGKVILGSDKGLKSLKQGQAKLVILSLNCDEIVRTDVERYAELAGIPIYIYPGDGTELGLACGKPFLVNVMTVIDPGSSNILNIGGN